MKHVSKIKQREKTTYAVDFTGGLVVVGFFVVVVFVGEGEAEGSWTPGPAAH